MRERKGSKAGRDEGSEDVVEFQSGKRRCSREMKVKKENGRIKTR